MKVLAIRTKMCGGGNTYHLLIPAKEVPHLVNTETTTVIRDGKAFFPFDAATIEPSHYQREKGWERYGAWLDHEKMAKEEELKILQKAFPELVGLKRLPFIVAGDLPSIEIKTKR